MNEGNNEHVYSRQMDEASESQTEDATIPRQCRTGLKTQEVDSGEMLGTMLRRLKLQR